LILKRVAGSAFGWRVPEVHLVGKDILRQSAARLIEKLCAHRREPEFLWTTGRVSGLRVTIEGDENENTREEDSLRFEKIWS
jgi:hypothetical protein